MKRFHLPIYCLCLTASTVFMTPQVLRAAPASTGAADDAGSGAVDIDGELLRDDLEGGVWNIRSGRDLYDLHGDIPFQDGDWVHVSGTPGDKLSCYHMRGTVLNVVSIEKSTPAVKPGGWTAFEHSLICSDASGAPVKTLRHVNRKHLLSGYDDPKESGSAFYKSAGVLAGGSLAWAIDSSHHFRMFDAEGQAVWSRAQAAHVVFSSQPVAAVLAVRSPSCPDRKPIEDCDLYAVVVSSYGKTLIEINDAPLLHREAVNLSSNGRYGYAKVTGNVDGTIFFDALTKKRKIYTGLGLPGIDDLGNFRILGKTGEFSSVKVIYSGSLANEGIPAGEAPSR